MGPRSRVADPQMWSGSVWVGLRLHNPFETLSCESVKRRHAVPGRRREERKYLPPTAGMISRSAPHPAALVSVVLSLFTSPRGSRFELETNPRRKSGRGGSFTSFLVRGGKQRRHRAVRRHTGPRPQSHTDTHGCSMFTTHMPAPFGTRHDINTRFDPQEMELA